MIGWLKGETLESWQLGCRSGITLACGGIGYEIQVLPRELEEINTLTEIIFWTHQVQKEDGTNLFGFFFKEERNLFRLLIGVNGIGPQIAMALLQEFEINELIQAINNSDIVKLTTAQGVGKKTAERIALELNSKISEYLFIDDQSPTGKEVSKENRALYEGTVNELKESLESLGYKSAEIQKAIQVIVQKQSLNELKFKIDKASSSDVFDSWLKESLIWLSKEAG